MLKGLAGSYRHLTLILTMLALEYRLQVVRGCQQMEKERIGQKIGFLRAGWWIIHLLGISAVYALGHFLW
jgi:hypothetical protein